MRNTLVILILIFTASLFCQGSDSAEVLLNTPLFERSSPFWQDYRVNQTIQKSLLWSSASTAVSVAILAKGDAENIFMLLTAFSLPVCGFVGGTVYGYIKGAEYELMKKNDPIFHLQRNRVGYEVEASTTTSNSLTFFSPRVSLCFQPLRSRKYWPSEYRLGFSFLRNVWLEDDDEIDSTPFYSYTEDRIELNVLYNSNKKYFQFHWGFGAGYSRGFCSSEIGSSTSSVRINGAFIYPVAGITINFNDFFYTRIEGRYEFSQFYYELLDHADYPATTNLSIGFSFGTYIF